MTAIQISALVVMALFYIAYFSKILFQRKKGIQTDQIGKGDKPKKILVVETLMKIATYTIVPVEIISILCDFYLWHFPARWLGIFLALIGVSVFVIAMLTMSDSWRAGIPEKDKTSLVTVGIYRFSRNPAFLGFDLMYLGLLVAFFNPIHLLSTLFSVIMLHLQILQEEKFLTDTFGTEYVEYKKRAGRYFIF